MENTWQHLPQEVLEKILINVPTSDLSLNKVWVCKMWTPILQKPMFWTRKLLDINITVEDKIKSALAEFEEKIQVASLYHASLNEEQKILKNPNERSDLSLSNISDDTQNMLKDIGVLIIRSLKSVRITLNKEKHTVLADLLKLLAVRDIEVRICDYYGFWNFSPRYNYRRTGC